MILTKKKNIKKSKSKTNSKYKSKSISNSRTRKHFNKSKKNDLRTRKMRGGMPKFGSMPGPPKSSMSGPVLKASPFYKPVPISPLSRHGLGREAMRKRSRNSNINLMKSTPIYTEPEKGNYGTVQGTGLQKLRASPSGYDLLAPRN
jgi:hypothetical protein